MSTFYGVSAPRRAGGNRTRASSVAREHRGLKNKPIKRPFHTESLYESGGLSGRSRRANVALVAIKVKLAVATTTKTTRPHLRLVHFERIESVTLCGQKDAVRFIAPLSAVQALARACPSLCMRRSDRRRFFFFYGRGQLLKSIQIRVMRHRGKRTSLKRPGFMRARTRRTRKWSVIARKSVIARERRNSFRASSL